MANDHYKHGGVETRDFASEVVRQTEGFLTRDEVIDMFNAIRYTRRAGFKDKNPWELDAEKTANYFIHFKYGKFKDQLIESGEFVPVSELKEVVSRW